MYIVIAVIIGGIAGGLCGKFLGSDGLVVSIPIGMCVGVIGGIIQANRRRW